MVSITFWLNISCRQKKIKPDRLDPYLKIYDICITEFMEKIKMNAFLRGMATIGELNPRPFNEYPPQYSQWQCVAKKLY